MRVHRFRTKPNKWGSFLSLYNGVLFFMLCSGANILSAQAVNQGSLSQQVQELTNAMARTQAQLEQSQHQLDEMRKQLADLQHQLGQGESVSSLDPAPPQASPVQTAEIENIRERQAMQESQIATHEQTKVESESKYPLKLTGLMLFNTFVNTNAVDMPATPTLAHPGAGSTGASLRQTVLGFDARGPHLLGAESSADLRVDFNGSPNPNSGYYSSNTLLRLRTAHAAMQWEHTRAFFSLDRPLSSPDTPTSLTAVAEPPLAWSGNLWNWNPQVGATQDAHLTRSSDLRLQAALIDVADAPRPPDTNLASIPPSSAEQSRWPGVEARIALLGSMLKDDGNRIGAGGYFAPHRALGHSFDAWAGTLDTHLLLPARLQFTASLYRGLALGGLGGGAYKDFAYRIDNDTGVYYIRPLDDIGGWTELKEKYSEKLQFNFAFGMDNVFSGELRPYAVYGGNMYQNLARNRTYTGNVIFSPSAYLLFSLEYRHLESSPVSGSSVGSNVIGIGAGYKF